MRCDSGASGQQPTSNIISIPKAVFRNERDLDRPTQNAQHGLSSASSLDLIAMSEDEEELVKLLLIPSSPHLKPLLEVRPKSVANATEGLDDRKPNPSYSVAVPSPPRRSTHELTHIEQGIPEQDASPQSRDPARAGGSSSKHVEKLGGDIMNGEVSDPVPPRPTRPTDSETTLLDHTRDGTVCGMKPLEDATERNIDTLLDAAPVTFDLSLSRHHLTSLKNGGNDGKSEGNSLWWCHPIFEARAKADIRRTLSALLPRDPAQDPPFPIGSADGRKSEMRPRQSGARIWSERLEDAFGPGPLNRGLGRKPSRVAAAAPERNAANSSHPQNSADKEVVIGNSHGSTPPRRLNPPSRNRLSSPEDVADEAIRPPDAGGVVDEAVAVHLPDVDGVALAEATNASIGENEGTARSAALPSLAKGLTLPDEMEVDALDEVGRANEQSPIREALSLETSAPARRATTKRSRPDDAELMSRKDLPDWKRCAWCVSRKIKCIPRIGSQPPYRCFHCEDGERKCVPYKKNKKKVPSRSSDHGLHPRLKIANNATGASLRRHSRIFPRPRDLEDVVIPAPPPEDHPLDADRRDARISWRDELFESDVRIAKLELHKAQHKHQTAKYFCEVAREQRRLANKRYLALLERRKGRPEC